MRREQLRNTNIGVGAGVLLQLAGFFWAQIGDAVAIGGVGLFLLSIPPFIWGCMNYAAGKGHPQWLGLAGLAGIVGLVILILLPDRDRQGSASGLQWIKVIGAISLLIGFGLAMLGLWLNNLAKDAAVEARVYPWPLVCMVSGAGLVAGSLLFLVRDSS